MTRPPIRIHYNVAGVPYSVHSTIWNAPAHVIAYARDEGVSWDGCRTTEDVDYRVRMLKSIARGHDDGRLKPPTMWRL